MTLSISWTFKMQFWPNCQLNRWMLLKTILCPNKILGNVSSSPDGVECLYSFGIYEHLKPHQYKLDQWKQQILYYTVIRMFLGFTVTGFYISLDGVFNYWQIKAVHQTNSDYISLITAIRERYKPIKTIQ